MFEHTLSRKNHSNIIIYNKITAFAFNNLEHNYQNIRSGLMQIRSENNENILSLSVFNLFQVRGAFVIVNVNVLSPTYQLECGCSESYRTRAQPQN